MATYDFDFDLHFACTHPHQIDHEETCVLRTGPVRDYQTEYDQNLSLGLRLINSPAEHRLASELEHWYPHISALTPRTQIYDVLPPADEIEANFRWPVFIKGSRQTSKHRPDLPIVKDRVQYESVTRLTGHPAVRPGALFPVQIFSILAFILESVILIFLTFGHHNQPLHKRS